MYKCGICGKEFNNVAERANCELNCVEMQEKDKAKNTLASLEKKLEEYKTEYTTLKDKCKEVSNKICAVNNAILCEKRKLKDVKEDTKTFYIDNATVKEMSEIFNDIFRGIF